jgi:hypothetical protein
MLTRYSYLTFAGSVCSSNDNETNRGTIMKQSERVTGARGVACVLSKLTFAKTTLASQEAHHSKKQLGNNVAQENSPN